jgi:hypothetical protein
MTKSYAQDPDLYEDDARPLRDETSLQIEVPAWLKKPEDQKPPE